jgi:uncharacterized protein GlcG (DUF336 family)
MRLFGGFAWINPQFFARDRKNDSTECIDYSDFEEVVDCFELSALSKRARIPGSYRRKAVLSARQAVCCRELSVRIRRHILTVGSSWREPRDCGELNQEQGCVMKPKKRREAKRRQQIRQLSNIESLEPRVVLGSMVPTETGTMVGSLVPIESVNALTSPVADPADVELAELQVEQAVESVKSDLNWLDRLERERQAKRAGKTDEDAEIAQDAAEDTAREKESKEKSSDQSNEDDSKHEKRVVVLDLTKGRMQRALADDSVESSESPADSESRSDVEQDADTTTGSETTGSEEDERNERRRSLTPRDESAQHRDRIAKEDSQQQGSVDSSNHVDITFAAGSGPINMNRPQGNGRLPALTRGGDRSGLAEQMNQVVQDAITQASGSFDSSSIGSFAPNAVPVFGQVQNSQPTQVAANPIVIRYDFRDIENHQNVITPGEIDAAESAMRAWSDASQGTVSFVQDTAAPESQIVNFGKGDLAAFGYQSDLGGTLALGGGTTIMDAQSGTLGATGIAWLDRAEIWDAEVGNGDTLGTYDAFTVFAHEIGHTLGGEDVAANQVGDIMNGIYDVERDETAVQTAMANHRFAALNADTQPTESSDIAIYEMHAMITGYPQLTAGEVAQLLDFATVVTPSEDAIIAIVDRGGNILGVRIEAGVPASAISTPANLAFSIDGAVAKARTAAFFANGDPDNGTFAPITSRLVRFISQSTVTLREVNSNPNVPITDEFVRGPGIVAPIGLGGHFPPEVLHTPPVDLFAIEQTNRDSVLHPGQDEIKGTADDITLMNRFNIDPAFVPEDTNGDGIADNPDVDMDGDFDLRIPGPESYGFTTAIMPSAQARGIATLPGGVPFYRDTDGDRIGETLIGGVGVFFPGPDGYASFEQGYAPGQSERDRTNAPKVLEAELIAVATAGGSLGAELGGPRTGGFGPTPGAEVTANPIEDIDIPFGRLDLVGIQLEVIGPTAGIRGVRDIVALSTNLGFGTVNGTNQVIDAGADGLPLSGDEAFTRDGESVPFGWLVTPHDGGDFNGDGTPDITAADVTQMINDGVAAAKEVRAAIRLPLGSRTRMVLTVTDNGGEVLGLFRMQDATIFSIDVAVAKARNVAYYADPTAGVLQAEDRIGRFESPNLVPVGTAITNRTVRFLSEPRFPSGVDGSEPGDFSILHDINTALGGTTPLLGRNEKLALIESAAPISVNQFNSANGTVLGHNSFFPSTNFRDPGDGTVGSADPATDAVRHQNGIVFFPGSTPVYKDGVLIGGFGVSGDGVDQDDVVTFNGAGEFLPGINTPRADEIYVDGVRLPYIKFLRNPRG